MNLPTLTPPTYFWRKTPPPLIQKSFFMSADNIITTDLIFDPETGSYTYNEKNVEDYTYDDLRGPQDFQDELDTQDLPW